MHLYIIMPVNIDIMVQTSSTNMALASMGNAVTARAFRIWKRPCVARLGNRSERHTPRRTSGG